MEMKQRLDAVQKAKRETAERQRAETEELARQQKDLVDRIKAGETTGDPIMDYALAQWFGDEHVVDCLKKLEEPLAGKTGQCIVTVQTEREWHSTGNGGGFGPSGFEELRRCDISLGFLSGEKLVLDLTDGAFGFQTGGQHVWRNTAHDTLVCAKDLVFPKDDFIHLPEIKLHVGGRGEFAVVAGNEAVLEWIETAFQFSLDLNMYFLLDASLMLRKPDELIEKQKELYDELVAKHAKDVEDAQGRLEQGHARLMDINRKLSLTDTGGIADEMRNAIRDLKSLEKRAVELQVDPKPITDFLTRYAK